jgi:hypothetical protein
VKGDLHRFKQVIETGEVMRSDGSPRGLGQKMQHPAQPLSGENRGRPAPRLKLPWRKERWGEKQVDKYGEQAPAAEWERDRPEMH